MPRLPVLRYPTSDVVFVCSHAGVSVGQRVIECEVVCCAKSAKVVALGTFHSIRMSRGLVSTRNLTAFFPCNANDPCSSG